MATSRKRSGTLLSQLSAQLQAHSAPVGSSITLQTSIHNNSNNYPNVLLNREFWRGIQVGDVIELRAPHMKQPCVFVVDQNDVQNLPYTVQVST